MRFLSAVFLLALVTVSQAAPVRVEKLRMWQAPDETRLVFDISAPVEHSVFTLGAPDRVVIDLQKASLSRPLTQPESTDEVLSEIRSAVRPNGDLRIVLDLKTRVRPKSFLLKPNRSYGHRLVLDLHKGQGKAVPRKASALNGHGRSRKIVVAIDAGHGGEDPGAMGRRRTREKDVVFAIAKELERLMRREPGMQPVMVRTGDYYVRLRKRIEIARAHRADLLVSIHADAFRDRRVKGSSVYVLSQHGASSEAARWLAERENSADLIGGVSLDDKDDLLASVLLDLSQTATIEASLDVGDKVLKGLRQLGRTHKTKVQQAGFAVLKSPDIPSILVETAFISNPQEEKRLRDPRHQRRLARAILRGIRAYFREHAPPGTLMAAREHVIQRGDTLSEIAMRYGVTTKALQLTNHIENSDRLRVGQILQIPDGQGS